MALDFDALRKKLNQISGNSSRRNVLWRPEEGATSTVRFISWQGEDEQPFKERYFYYNIGNNPGILAPYQFGKPDPVQELITKLRSDGSKSSYELAKKLYPKMRVYAPIVVRGEENRGVRIWSFGKMVYQSLLNLILDEDFGDITDTAQGFDIKVTCTKAPGRQFATTEIQARPKTSKLSDDANKVKEWLGKIPDLDDLYTLKTYEEIEKIVNDWLSGSDDDSDAKDENPRGSPNKPVVDVPKKASSFNDIDDAFAELEDL